MEYKVRAEKISGNEPFCNLIQAQIEGDLEYSGPLLLFIGGPSLSVGLNMFNLSLPDATGVVNDDSCQIDLVYTAWAKDAPDEQGYVDEERVHITLTAIGLPEQAPALFNAFGLFGAEDNGGDSDSNDTAEQEQSASDESSGDESEDEANTNKGKRERSDREDREERKDTKEDSPEIKDDRADAKDDAPSTATDEPPADQTPMNEEVSPPVTTDAPDEPQRPTEPVVPAS
jgi:hypothetical protein